MSLKSEVGCLVFWTAFFVVSFSLFIAGSIWFYQGDTDCIFLPLILTQAATSLWSFIKTRRTLIAVIKSLNSKTSTVTTKQSEPAQEDPQQCFLKYFNYENAYTGSEEISRWLRDNRSIVVTNVILHECHKSWTVHIYYRTT